ncbi:hypothetical protein AX16_002335 [Volvariella volvacea WC 439]|nr:hypothetical protein AX16_002335 [Volvariella volvacea WC 439]
MNFYFEAAKTLDRLDAKQGSIKGILATIPEKGRKRTAALVIQTLKYKSVLQEVITRSNLLKDERKKITSLNLALVLVHDLLLCNGIQAGGGPVKQALLRHKTRLHGEFKKIKIKQGVKTNAELAQSDDPRAVRIPRYVRINTIIWSTDDAIQTLLARGFQQGDPSESRTAFARDQHIPDLLLFHPQITFHDDPLYKDGKIILQDKASCMPAFVLSPPAREDTVAIDATAAPGNKTSHLSALMGSQGKIYAFERDRRRFSTLKTMLSKAQCKNVEPLNADFLSLDPSDPQYSQVTHILLDPSCSGSGIVNRLDYLLEADDENDTNQEERLGKLSAFQFMMVKHAMKFPRVEKIVYSTCSIHAAENEHVVRAALGCEEARGRFVLAPRDQVIPTWERRGLDDEMGNTGDASALIRCLPGDDATNGFFISCFVRQPPSSLKRKNSIGDISNVPRKKKRRKAAKKSS